MSIVSFIGAKGSGKSSCAKYIIKNSQRTEHIAFAKPIKEMMRHLHLTEEQINGSEKNLPIPWAGNKTARYLMQTIGTEWGRELVHPDLWLNVFRGSVNDCLIARLNVVNDDCRFPNEFAAVKELGATTVTIIRPGLDETDTHESERYWKDFDTDIQIINDTTEEDLHKKLAQHPGISSFLC